MLWSYMSFYIFWILTLYQLYDMFSPIWYLYIAKFKYEVKRSVQFTSASQSYPTLCDPKKHRMPGPPSITNFQSLPKLMSFDSIMPSNHSSSVVLFSSCPQSFPASGSFQWVSSLHQVVKVLELQLQHQSFQWIFRVDFL